MLLPSKTCTFQECVLRCARGHHNDKQGLYNAIDQLLTKWRREVMPASTEYTNYRINDIMPALVRLEIFSATRIAWQQNSLWKQIELGGVQIGLNNAWAALAVAQDLRYVSPFYSKPLDVSWGCFANVLPDRLVPGEDYEV